ncbi:hypothetical protein D3C85_1840460 [compost metagenome]
MTAAKGITLGDGSGAYIKIANGRVEIASPVGEINVKGSLRAQSPAGGSFAFPAWHAMPVQDVKGTMNFSFSK